MKKIFGKGNKLYPIIYNFCPRCHEGKFWPSNEPYRNLLIEKGELGSCKVCDLKFELENGFWYGAMYFSYAIGVAIMSAAWIITCLISPEINIFLQITIIISCIILLFPFNYYFSRILWINIFISYDEKFR